MGKNKFVLSADIVAPTEGRLQELRTQVQKLSEIHQPEQRSDEWYKMRNEMITASDWAAVLGENKYASKLSVIKKKCGQTDDFFGGFMAHGVKYEPVACKIYESRNKVSVKEFGCLQHPEYPFLGASPDGITEDGVMLEIKCPPKREITGEPPQYYWIQVQGQLEVCNLDRCDFLECKIEEYINGEEYFADKDFKNERGIVMSFINRKTNKKTFEYSDFNIDFEKYDKWSDELIAKYLKEQDSYHEGTSFWKLIDVSCVPIFRDKDWFNNNLPKLKDVWTEIVRNRETGAKFEKKRSNSSSNAQIYTRNNYDSDEDNNNNKYLFSV